MDILTVLGKVGFDWQVALANFVNFLVIFFILKKFAFKPIGKVIKERQEKIEKGLEEAREASVSLKMAKNQKEEILKEGKEKVSILLTQVQEDKKKIIKEARDEALEEKDQILKQAKIDAQREKDNAEMAFTKEASTLVLAGIRKIVTGYVEAGKGEEIIKGMIKK